MHSCGLTRFGYQGKALLAWIAILWLGLAPGSLPAQPISDDEIESEEHSELTVYISNTPFQFSPGDPENGTTLIVASISYPSQKDDGIAAWELAIYGPGTILVRSYYGNAHLAPEDTVSVAQVWDGRDRAGQILPDGEYQYQFNVRYIAGLSPTDTWVSYDMVPLLLSNYEIEGARAHTRIQTGVNALALNKNQGANKPIQTRADPLDPAFSLKFYYGYFHSQTNFSDGGWAPTNPPSCNQVRSGRYCQGDFGPPDAYNYGRYTGKLDFLGITDHNHLLDCSSYYREGVPYTCRMDPATVLSKYQQGLAAAINATEDGAFVAVYGQEFGVTTQRTDGHVGVLEAPAVFNWEEHEQGSCYDVFVGRSQYTDLYTAMVNNPSPWGAIGILNHPSSAYQFNSFEISDAGRDAVVGIEVVNGPAWATSELQTCGGTHYDGDNTNCLPNCQPDCTLACNLSQHHYMSALNKGFRVAPYAEQDNHYHNFGTSTANRTVVLANALTRDEIMKAVRMRRVFATSKDPDAQLVFITADGAHMMGDAFTTTSPINFHSSVRHPDGRNVADELRVYLGYPETGRVPSLARTCKRPDCDPANYDFSLVFRSGDYAYVFLYIKQVDGSELWSAPMWLTVN